MWPVSQLQNVRVSDLHQIPHPFFCANRKIIVAINSPGARHCKIRVGSTELPPLQRYRENTKKRIHFSLKGPHIGPQWGPDGPRCPRHTGDLKVFCSLEVFCIFTQSDISYQYTLTTDDHDLPTVDPTPSLPLHIGDLEVFCS